jgi:acetyltransferase-like isoleucine patch superfamily enzyme
MSIKDTFRSNPKVKEFILWTLSSPRNPRPRWWVRVFVNPFLSKKGKGSLIRRNTRMDIFPWNKFSLGKGSTIEDYVTINNGVGDVIIGNSCRIGMGNTVIGPVTLGNHVIFAQNIVLSGLNHGYQDILTPISLQPVSKSQIVIEDEVWIGANSTVVAGVTIGRHSVIAAGSVVTRNVPPYSIAAGNPARIIKQYNNETGAWEKVKP